MTNENKKFRIEQIDRYEEQISEEERNATKQTFLFGLSSAAMVSCLSTQGYLDPNTTIHFIELFLGLLNAGMGAHSLKSLIVSISRKTALQEKLEELKMEESNENEGKKR